MGTETGQTSQLAPAVIYDNVSTYHMLFKSNDSSNNLLYMTSTDGQNWDFNASPQPTGQTTSAAPAIALYQYPSLEGGFITNQLVGVFKANDNSDRILYATLDLNEPANERGWRFGGQVGSESAQWVTALSRGGDNPSVSVYYISADSSDRILETNFTP
jgi:hypothetical protein